MGIFTPTRLRSSSSSAPVLPAVRIKSPMSDKTNPGITVSRSMTQSTSSVSASNSILFTFVSQWFVRFFSFPSRYRRSWMHIASARFSISSTSSFTSSRRFAAFALIASRNCCKRNSILWKFGIVSLNVPSGIFASMVWKSPNAFPAS